MKKILITNSTCIQDNIGGASRSVHEISLELSQFYNITLVVPNRNIKEECENAKKYILRLNKLFRGFFKYEF